MKTDAIIKKVKEIPGGRFFRVRYISKVKMTAAALQDGITIFKIVDTTTRTGVKYNNIEGVKPTDYPDEYTPKQTNWEWVVKNRIKHNTKTGKDYLVIAPIGKGAHTVSTYIMTDAEGYTRKVEKSEVEQYAVASYWKEEKPAIMNVTLENVLMVK